MSSYRKQIAEAFRAVLSGRTAVGESVHTKLDRPWHPGDGNTMMIYANEAERGPQDYGNSIVPRVVTVFVEAAVIADEATALDLADDLADQVEAIIEGDPSLGNVVQQAEWQRSRADISSEGETTLGVILMQYHVTMATNLRDPSAFGVGDDGFDGVPVVVYTLPDTTIPNIAIKPEIFPDPQFKCGPDGCAPPAWGGEVKKNGDLIK